MTWYTAHCIEGFRFRNTGQLSLTFYENLFLVEADSDKAALQAAEVIAKASVVDDDSLTVDDQPVEALFLGVRKVVRASNPNGIDADADKPTSGTELSYTSYKADNLEALEGFAAGQSVGITALD